MKKVYLILLLCIIIAFALCGTGYYTGSSLSQSAKSIVKVKNITPQASVLHNNILNISNELAKHRGSRDFIEGMKYQRIEDIEPSVSAKLRDIGGNLEDISIKPVDPKFYLFRKGVVRVYFSLSVPQDYWPLFLSKLAESKHIWFFSRLDIAPNPGFVAELSSMLGVNNSKERLVDLAEKVVSDLNINVIGEFYTVVKE